MVTTIVYMYTSDFAAKYSNKSSQIADIDVHMSVKRTTLYLQVKQGYRNWWTTPCFTNFDCITRWLIDIRDGEYLRPVGLNFRNVLKSILETVVTNILLNNGLSDKDQLISVECHLFILKIQQ